MNFLGIIVRVKRDYYAKNIEIFKSMQNTSVYLIETYRIILRLDCDDIKLLINRMKEIENLEGVIDIYPVFYKDGFIPF